MFRALLIACCLTSFPALAGRRRHRRAGEPTAVVDEGRRRLQGAAAFADRRPGAGGEGVGQRAGGGGAFGVGAGVGAAFIAAQMDAAKAIQYRYRADWLANPEPGWQPRPLAQVRPQIAQLSSQILQRLAELRAGPLGEADRAAFMASVDQVNLSAADKRRLADALLAVKTGSAR